ncbi:MAG: UDP-N-acetylmuramoyl-L-alanyl-D-glutamate--2,6-diaminopimelate ligase [Methylocystis sp.]|nr:UDP-N-acetylmuramoyl-L-alanyl-D-glutamate--2,6-diaminopimelate ligase [Methylocystis sp.]
MRLAELLCGVELDSSLRDLEVAGLAADSRAVREGFVFFAVPGAKSDGLAFAGDAKTRGAGVIVAPQQASCDLPLVSVPDVRAALARAAALFYPRQPQTIAAVTGTSGKTSVVAFLRQLWAAAGHEAASLGTVGLVDGRGAHDGSLTTPDPILLHQTLDDLAARSVTHLAMEASSHGLDQRRLDGVRLAAGAFTNLTRDHLDYHANFDDYLAAKLRLFDTLLQPGQTAVIDADSDGADRVVAACCARGLSIFSIGARGETIRIISLEPFALATRLRVRFDGADYQVNLPLVGAFQASNALVAAALAIATGEDASCVFAALENLQGAPGRLELVGKRLDAPVFVDYAHKPDALYKVLATLRPLTHGRLIVAFGCGGERDKGKRPLMGEIAGRAADIVIVTDDNPRSEDAALIRAAVLDGARAAAHAKIIEIGDRRLAIREGVAQLRAGDTLLVAGKGHETTQIVGDIVLPFSDHAVIAEALRGQRT